MVLRGVATGRLTVVLVVVVASCLGCEGRGCHDNERRALLEINKVYNPLNRSLMSYWGDSLTEQVKDCCHWPGIICNPSTGHVVELQLLIFYHWRDVEGTWHPNLTMLAEFGQLESLNLRDNQIGGGIPEAICHLKLLKTLDLSDNKFDGSIPSCLCTLTSLRELDLSSNNLEGSIPSCLCTLRSLRELDLSSNNLEGSIPSYLCSLRSLRELDLSSNKLKGSIPSCLCTLRSLRKLDLSNNSLLGDIPSCFGSFHFLTSLYLSGNQFQWNDSSWLCNMHSLTFLSISNDISPTTIPSCIGNLNRLNFLRLTGDWFKGSIPSSIFSNLTDLSSLEINSSRFEGTLQFSVLANLSKLSKLDIYSFGGLEINTEYPISWVPSFQLIHLSIVDCVVNKRSGGRFPSFLKTQGGLQQLTFEGTSIQGTLPAGFFCNTSLSVLSLSRNHFSGPFLVPCCNASQNVQFIDLSDNDLNMLPENIGLFFPTLISFRMPRNKLEGHIPASLGHTLLSWLDLSDNILSGKLPPTLMRNQSRLFYLDVSSNHLEGEMFPIDAEMPSLDSLIVHNNNFTGLLLPRLAKCSGLRIIDAGYNSLTYNFSQTLPYFPNIVVLSLRMNHIHGYLPKQLCEMQHLRLLDLSGNNLSGKILPCLHNISSWRSKILDWDASASYSSVTYYFGWKYAIQSDSSLSLKSKNSIRQYNGEPLQWMTHLDLSMNMISGIIPQEIGELQGLQSLDLSKNHIQGSLPKSMADMDNLESLDLSHNGFSGSIPNEMAQLTFLETFSVAFNNMTGMIPNGIQFRSFNESSFEGNPGLCGLPLQKECSSDNERTKGITTTGDGGRSKDYKNALFFVIVTTSFTLGFWGFLVSLFFNKSWRVKYFKFIDQLL
ncbi:unnamed protein product [Spirodela intermedia]|uniref:Disease resistance R13L4/SHOC-2-like LRR domain-containing protein n=1 Tax=Spirodela intermedia TaxID=51605 RepID=A0A7I8LIZ5_SPIIN|nr:unnamed protein product [Spirodela intermedia]